MVNDNGKRSRANRFWGRMARFEKRTRVVLLAFVVASIVAMPYAQLGFWRIGIIDGKSVYLMLLLGPLIMGSFLFGPLTGAILGLFAGIVVFTHAAFLPLDFYEVYFMTPLNTFVLLTFIGALAGWLFYRVLRNEPQGANRVVRILVVCLLLSCLASILVQVNVVIAYGRLTSIDIVREHLLCSPLGVVVQILIDAALEFALCMVLEAMVRMLSSHESERSLLSVFGSWMFVISLIVFMVSGSAIFSFVTYKSQVNANESMHGEIVYLVNQLNTHEATENSPTERESNEYESLLDGYRVSLDGWLVITDERGIILASDDEENYPPGKSLVVLLNYEDDGDNFNSYTLSEFAEACESDDIVVIQLPGKNGEISMDIMFLSAGAYDGGYVVIMRTSEMVYSERLDVMIAITLLAILLIGSIALVASRLLKRVVVSRIDEANTSLGKITEGDLNERVRIRDSREFASLSSGINTTVEALKDSIAEAEQKNAQELATAKAIQESALPTDFPAFPDIDRFDIYASMKTAKEVGGDFYDFFTIEGTTKIGFVMADVSGKGIPAALFMMTAKTQVRNYMESGIPIDEAVNAANHQLCLSNDAGMFVTMVASVLNYETGELTYVNAGHNPPLILHDDEWSWMRDVSGMPLGLFDGIPYDPIERQLVPGDMIYLYTDGVTEAMDTSGALFGEDRLESTLKRYSEFNPRSVSVGVRRAITDFTLDCEQSDDITMLCLKYGVPPEEKAMMILNATVDQLVHVINYIHAELHRRNAPQSVYNPLDIAAEELFVNVCHYAYPDATPDNPGEVRISFEYEANPPTLSVQIADNGIPYNPLAKPDAVTPDDIMEVPIGGLGILMAKRSVDDMTYERVDDSNVLTFSKSW